MGPDLELGRRFLAAHPPPGRTLLCAVIGSHLYGYPTPDSDLDLKGIYLTPTAELLGLSSPGEVHDQLGEIDGTTCDLTLHEIGRALALLLKGNGNVLEQVTSEHQLVQGPELDALRGLVPRALSRACHAHYRGYLRGMIREHERDGRLKSLLGTFRVGLTGVHLLQRGEIVCHLPTLAEHHGFTELLPLIERKRSTLGRIVVAPGESEPLRARWPELEAGLDDARAHSPLPETPPDPERCEAWLIALRRAQLEEA
ncbi:MAG TPA: nucleotidyltransferase domain-containing protein [Deltaproteobacteria bacterium]|nr:nucleotidyltransferase domain-containing protein [Deltaproteobacteria bacterium]